MATPTTALRLASPLSMRTIRRIQELTLRELQDKSGVNVALLSMAEAGRLLLDDEQLAAIARALDVDVAMLLVPPDEVLRTVRSQLRTGAKR